MKYLIYVLLLMLSFSLQGQILTGSEVKDDLLQLKKAIRIYNYECSEDFFVKLK